MIQRQLQDVIESRMFAGKAIIGLLSLMKHNE